MRESEIRHEELGGVRTIVDPDPAAALKRLHTLVDKISSLENAPESVVAATVSDEGSFSTPLSACSMETRLNERFRLAAVSSWSPYAIYDDEM